MTIIIVAILVFVSVVFIFLIGAQTLTLASNQYRSHFVTSAKTNLSDLFIFIEPEKIYIFNVIVLILSFLFLWLYFGSFIPALIVAIALAFIPQLLYKFLKYRRIKRFNESLPDSLNSLSTMLKAGTNLTSAIEIMTKETKGPISQEFELLMREIKMGKDMSQAFDSMNIRVPSDDLSLVVAGIKISREVGGSLAEVLARLADTIRRRIEMEGKIDSLTAMGKAQGFVMAMLPLVLAYAISKLEPEAMSQLFTTPIGWGVCVIVVVMEIMGFLVIRKIVNIDV